MTGLSSHNVYPQSLTADATYALSIHRTGQYGIQRDARFQADLLDESLKALQIAMIIQVRGARRPVRTIQYHQTDLKSTQSRGTSGSRNPRKKRNGDRGRTILPSPENVVHERAGTMYSQNSVHIHLATNSKQSKIYRKSFLVVVFGEITTSANGMARLSRSFS